MTALNVVAVATINAKSAGLALTTSAADIIAAISSNHIGLVDSLYVSNVDGSNAETCTITVVKSGPSTFNLAKVVSVPAGATLIVISKDDAVNLEEGDKIQGLAGSSSKLQAFASWKDLS